MPKVAVVILNYNGVDFLKKFLPGVIKYSQNEAEVIVADNASTDHSVQFMQEEFPDIRLIINPNNGGFAQGYNDALSQIEADYFVLLNSDIEIKTTWLKPIIDLMESDPSIAACQPKILSWHEPNKFEYAGGAGGFIDKFGYPFCRGRIFMSMEEDKGQYDQKASEIFWATGACLFVRSRVFDEVGGFDNDFFAHMEEIDLCWRIKHLGYKIMFEPKSAVYHIGGGTLPRISPRKTYLNYRNNSIVLIKNLNRIHLLWLIGARLILDGIAGLKFLVEGDIKHTVAVVRAHYYLYANLGKMIKKRRAVQRSKTVTRLYKGNIVFDHFLRGVKFFNQLDPKKFT